MSGARGSGRTYKIMGQMLDTIFQNWSNPLYKYMFFVSPNTMITKHHLREFAEKHLTTVKRNVWEVVGRNNSVTFLNGVSIFFINSKNTITEEVFYNMDRFKGMHEDMLFFEDHTVYSLHWDNIWIEFNRTYYEKKKREMSEAEFKRLMYGDWNAPNNRVFKQQLMGEWYHEEEDDV